jgi:hypothetical protein
MTTISEVTSVLKPISELELKIISTPEFLTGVDYGKPRPGHPEGKVLYHIKDVLDKIGEFHLDRHYYEKSKLRLIALTHDTLKYKVDKSMPRVGQNHHGFFARQYLEQFCQDQDVLQIVEKHDDAYNIWNSGQKTGKWTKANSLARKLVHELDKNLNLYLAFYQCDNSTGNKNPEPYNWFSNQICFTNL